MSVPIRERHLKRIHAVMMEEYKPLDRKEPRDEFSHGEGIDESALPVADVQGLVRKFLRLHVNRP